MTFLKQLLGESSSSSTAAAVELPNVVINRYFVSDAECSLFHSLWRVIGDKARILAQVSLQQLLHSPPAASQNRRNATKFARAVWQSKVRAKSIDFLLI